MDRRLLTINSLMVLEKNTIAVGGLNLFGCFVRLIVVEIAHKMPEAGHTCGNFGKVIDSILAKHKAIEDIKLSI